MKQATKLFAELENNAVGIRDRAILAAVIGLLRDSNWSGCQGPRVFEDLLFYNSSSVKTVFCMILVAFFLPKNRVVLFWINEFTSAHRRNSKAAT